jgi:hypothetical protein
VKDHITAGNITLEPGSQPVDIWLSWQPAIDLQGWVGALVCRHARMQNYWSMDFQRHVVYQREDWIKSSGGINPRSGCLMPILGTIHTIVSSIALPFLMA